MTDTLAPARCPSCGSPVTLTLASDPDTPVYLCGSTPSRIVCDAPAVAGGTFAVGNVAGLTIEDVVTIGRLTNLPMVFDRRIALGKCGHVTIAGECLSLDDPMRADP